MPSYDTTVTAIFTSGLAGRSFEIRLDNSERVGPQFVGPDDFWPGSPSSFLTEHVTYLPGIKGGPDTDIDPSNGNLNAVTITILSRGEGTRQLALREHPLTSPDPTQGGMFHLADGANVSLVLDGKLDVVGLGQTVDNTSALIAVGRQNWAELRGSGVTLRDNSNQGNHNSHNDDWGKGSGGLWVFGYVVMKGGEISNTSGLYCGGVLVDGQGTFLMDGGKVINTTTTNTNNRGGGIALYSGFFIMREGEISGNTGGNSNDLQFSLHGSAGGVAVWPSNTHGSVYLDGLSGGISYEKEGPASLANGGTVNFTQNANTVIKAERSSNPR
jgi:hypothetical protein